MKRTPVIRRTPLRRSKPMRRQSAKQAAKQRSWAVVTEETRRENRGCCAVDRPLLDPAKTVMGCLVYATTGHHILPRSQGGPNTRANCLPVCANCHRYIHAHPKWAREHGYLKGRAK